MSEDDDGVARTDAPRGFDVGLVLENKDVPAHEARERGHREDRHRHDDVQEAAPQNRHDPDREQNAGKREEHVRDAHHDAVGPAFVVTGEKPQHGADDGAREDTPQARHQREPRPRDDAAEDVAPQAVDPEPVHGRGAFVQVVVVEEVFGVVRDHPGAHDRGEDEERHHDERDHPHAVLRETAQKVRPRTRTVVKTKHHRPPFAKRTAGLIHP